MAVSAAGRTRAVVALALVLACRAVEFYEECAAPPGVDVVECVEGSGTVDCNYCAFEWLSMELETGGTTCAHYKQDHTDPQKDLALLILGAAVACAMAFGIGGNDAANSWGTSVGSGAIGVQAACLLGGLGEVLGATLLGAGVSSTVQKGVAVLDGPGSEDCWACGLCDSKMAMYQWGMFAALCGAALFLLSVTVCGMPVSTTHAIVGGVVGMTWAGVGGSCLNWSLSGGLGAIVLSWAASPLFAGLVGVCMYLITYYGVFRAKSPLDAAYVMVPMLYGFTSAVMLYLILMKSPMTKKAVSPLLRASLMLATLAVVPALVHFAVMPRVKREVVEKREALVAKKATSQPTPAESAVVPAVETLAAEASPAGGSPAEEGRAQESPPSDGTSEGNKSDSTAAGGAGEGGMQLFKASTPTSEQLLAKHCFKALLVFNAFLESFAHGANDTANATGPFGALYNTYRNGIYACSMETTPWWIMFIAGFFVFLGVNTMGYRVIRTMGQEIVEIDFHIGFCVEFASGFAVVVATLMGMPVSTTHCQVGAVVFVGAVSAGVEGVSWRMFGKIGLTWVATLPAAGGLSALVVFLRYYV